MLAQFRASPRASSQRNGTRAAPEFEPGTLYRHVTETNMTELASVIDTKTDEFGIRHIRFLLAYKYQHRIIEAGERTLAMTVFNKRFSRTTTPAPPTEPTLRAESP